MRPAPDPTPAAALVAGVLGIVGVLPLVFVVLVVASLTTDDGSVAPGWLLLLLAPVAHLTGAVLLLCRRSWLVLALSCVPPLLGLALLFLGSGNDLTGFFGPLAGMVLPALTLGFTLQRSVRDWVHDRTTSGR